MIEPIVISRKPKASPSLCRNRRPSPRLGGRAGGGGGGVAGLGLTGERIGADPRLDVLVGGAAAAPVGGQRLLALDQPPRHIVRHRCDDPLGALVLGDQHPAVAGVLKEAERAAVVGEIDEADHVEEQPRPLAVGDAEVEQFDVVGRLIDDRPHRVFEHFQTRDLRLADFGERVVLLGAFRAGAPQGAAQVRRLALI